MSHPPPINNNWQRSLAARHLLPLLRDCHHALLMSLTDWDDTIRLARQARLLGLIAGRLKENQGLWEQVPVRVRGHLQSSINFSAHRQQMVRMELRDLDNALPQTITVVLLKGAAYIAQNHEFAQGRLPNDVDLLVKRHNLEEAEAALASAGWTSEATSDYDQRYYREWSHELPPMRFPGHALEVDLHHTITPVTSRVRADDNLLFSNLQPVPDSRYFTLHPFDQIIHAAIHLFQDSDLSGHLRDLVDLDGMVRREIHDESDWTALQQRADQHGAGRYLYYALRYCSTWLSTPTPKLITLQHPSSLAQRFTDMIMTRGTLPRLPDSPPRLCERFTLLAGVVRYHYLRMPPKLLAEHLIHKATALLRRKLSVFSRTTQKNETVSRGFTDY